VIFECCGMERDKDFWDVIEEVLKQKLAGRDELCASVLRALQREHIEYINSLSLDEIEMMSSPAPETTKNDTNRK